MQTHRLSYVFVWFAVGGALFADQVTLKNGDSLNGTIIKKDGDNLTLKSDFLGEVTMPWSAVTSVQSDHPIYVVLPGNNQVNGKVNTASGNVEVVAPPHSEAAPLSQISAIRNDAEQTKYERTLNPTWLQLWTGYTDIGLSLARGNAVTQTLNTAFNAVRNTSTDQTTVFLNQIYSTAVVDNVNGATANAIRGGVSYSHNLSPKVFLNFSNTDETDQFQDLNYRFVGGLGAGYHAIKTDRMVWDLTAGADYDHASFTTTTRNLAEANAGDNLLFKLSKTSTITQALRIYGAPQNGQYRVDFDLAATTTIRKWLSWQVSASDRYLSDPTIGRKSNDVLLTTGIRASFAR